MGELRDRVLETLQSESPDARFAAAFVLFHAERPSLRLLSPLLASLELADGDARWQAAHLLALLGRLHAEVLPVLVHEVVEGPSSLRRRMALYAARELAPERPETLTACLRALEDADGDVRRAALTCFAKLRCVDHAALERVLEIARADDDARMRRIAAVVLGELALGAPEDRPAIEAALRELGQAEDASLVRAAAAARRRLESAGVLTAPKNQE